MQKKPSHYIINLRPPADYMLQTDIVSRIMKATKSKKKEDQLMIYIEIDEKMAWDILTLNIGNRHPTFTDIEKYALDMANGKWWFLGNTLKVDYNGRLIDGQKELAAIINSKTKQVYHIQCGLDPDCASAVDTGRNRTLADALTAAGFTDPNNKASAIRTILCMQKFQQIPGGLQRGQKIDNQMVLDWCHSKSNITLLEKAISKGLAYRKESKFFAVATWGALWFLFTKINVDEGDFFVSKMANPIDLNTRNIRDTNINLLRQKLGLMDSGNKHRLTKHYKDERFRYVMRSWNASRDGERLHKLDDKTVDLESPKIEKPY